MRPPARALRLLALASLALAPAARAQSLPLPGEAPTRGPEVPAGEIAGAPEATAIALNPSNLAFLDSWNAYFLYTDLEASGARGPGGGGLYLASPLPFVKSLAAGAAVEWVRPPDAFPYRDEAKLSLALAWRPTRMFSLGATYAHVFTGETPGVDRLDTLDLAATGHFGRYLSIALVVHDVPSPQFQGLGIQRVYQPEIAFRPTGDDRFELAASVRIGERRGDANPAARFRLMPIAGLMIRGAVEVIPDLYGNDSGFWDVRATLGLELDLAHAGVGGWALFGGNPAGAAYHGFAVTARASGDRYPTVLHLGRFERVDLAAASPRKRVALLARLRRLERDRHLEGILVVVGDLDGSWATMEELRDAFARLRAAGKHVFVYATELTTRTYYAATGAERIFLDPAGSLRLAGMSSTTLFLKGGLDKLGVDAEFVRIAEYKSAPEQLTRTGPSEQAQEVRNAILDDVYGRVVDAIALARRADKQKVRAWLDAGPYTPGEAKRAGLVDDLLHADEIEDAIGTRLGHRIEAVPPPSSPERARSFAARQVAVLMIDGDIVDGKSRTIPLIDRRLVGHRTIIEDLERARLDPRVVAIVLRVDSPGGSALASDLIEREVERARAAKPVVCSFGDTAASGGYYLAAPCDAIFAAPSTITGSIGIFSGKADVSGLLRKIGVNADVLRRGLHADMESVFRPYTDEERAKLLENLRYYYGRFVSAVARGRKLQPAEVDAVGRGHVWTGAQARERRLVDRLGGLMDAIVEAKRRAGLDEKTEVELALLPEEPTSLLGQLLQLVGLGGDAERERGLASIPALVEALREIPPSLLLAPSTPLARLPYEVAPRP